MWSTDNDRTEANDEVVIKTVYDPSPVGYSLPASNAFTGFTTTGQNTWNSTEFNVKFPFDKGYYFYTKPNKQGETFFFPAFGFRYSGTGSLNVVSTYGYCWVAGPDGRNRGRYLSFYSGDVYPLNYAYRSYGFAVRSAEEKETHKFNIKWEMDGVYYNLWSTDNERTDGNDDVVIKSVYDPSPVGYTVPAPNAFTGFTTTGQNTGDWTNPVTSEQVNAKLPFDKGYYFYTKPNKQGTLFWFSASGHRRYDTGSLIYVATDGCYWSAGPNNWLYGRHLDFSSGFVYPLHGTNRSYGWSVRSAEEKETHKFNIKPEMDGQYYNLWSTDTIGLLVLTIRTTVQDTYTHW